MLSGPFADILSSMLIPGFWVLLIYVVFLLSVRRIGKRAPETKNQDRDDAEQAINIIKERLAKGEITKEEFFRLKREVLDASEN